MLTSLRKAAGTWVATLFILLLALSFAVWGIGDMFRTDTDTTVVSIGESEVSQEAYRNLVQQRVSEVSRNLGRQLSFREAQLLGIEQQVMDELLVDLTLQEDARALGLNLTDEAAGQLVMDSPAFAGPNGEFSRQRLQQAINLQYGSEAALLAEVRRQALRQQIYTALTAGLEPTDTQLALLHRYQNEERSISYVTLDEADVPPVADPSEEQLASYYEENRARYRAPELRSFSLINLTEEDVRQRIEVPEEDLRRYYENNRRAFTTPERREVFQLNFDDMESARAAHEQLAQGKSFEQLAAERDLAERDYSLGLVSREDMIDQAYAEAAFSLAEGEVSDPVEGRFGAALLKVAEVQPAQEQGFAEVRDQLLAELRAAEASTELLDVYDEVEDLRAAGATLEEAARQLDLPFRRITASAEGTDANGNPVEVPGGARVLGTVFEADPADELDAVDTRSGFIWVHVDSVTPERERDLSEVREQVVADWKAEQLRQRLVERATELVAELKAGRTLQAIAQRLDSDIRQAQGLQREAEAPNLSPAALELAFATPEGGYAHARGESDASRIIFQVSDVSLAGSGPSQELVAQLSGRLAQDLMQQYMSMRQQELGLVINETNRLRAIGQAPASSEQ